MDNSIVSIVFTPDMPILCPHVQVYTLRRLTIDGFSFKRVAQFNLEWTISNLDSGFQSLVGFRILSAGFRIPEAKIPGFRNPDSLTWGVITTANKKAKINVKYFTNLTRLTGYWVTLKTILQIKTSSGCVTLEGN